MVGINITEDKMSNKELKEALEYAQQVCDNMLAEEYSAALESASSVAQTALANHKPVTVEEVAEIIGDAIEDFLVYKPVKYVPHNDKKKAFTLNRVTRLNSLVVPLEWSGIDILYNKENNLIGIRRGSLVKAGVTRKDKLDYSGRNFNLSGFMNQFGLVKSKWIYKFNKDGIDIYELKETKENDKR